MSITPSPAAGTRPALPDLQGCRVLLAEDNPVNQRLLVRLLEHVGVQVSVSDNGQQALQQVGEQAFDLLLMDVQMPVLDGLAATRAIRQLGPRGQLPIIAISASTFTEDRQRCLAAGMDDFLAKPIRIEQLYACLAQHLGRHAARLPGEPDAAPRADQPALPRIAGLDTGLGLQHSGGEHALYLDLLQRLLDGERDSPARLRRALDDADLLGAQRLAHTLKGLAGDAIPVAARLMAIADVYDALISNRIYKAAMSHAEAVKIIRDGRGSHFDPDMVDAFLALRDEFAHIATRYADEPWEAVSRAQHGGTQA